MLSELHDPRRVGTGPLPPHGGDVSVMQLLASGLGGAAPSESERILLVAFCSTCHAQVIRRFDLEGIELVIRPWEHRYPRTDHTVTGVEIEDPRVEHVF